MLGCAVIPPSAGGLALASAFLFDDQNPARSPAREDLLDLATGATRPEIYLLRDTTIPDVYIEHVLSCTAEGCFHVAPGLNPRTAGAHAAPWVLGRLTASAVYGGRGTPRWVDVRCDGVGGGIDPRLFPAPRSGALGPLRDAYCIASEPAWASGVHAPLLMRCPSVMPEERHTDLPRVFARGYAVPEGLWVGLRERGSELPCTHVPFTRGWGAG